MNKIELKGVSKTFKERELFSNVDISLESGKIYGLIGPNGSGKSVLFKMICGLLPLSSGEIYYNNQLLHKDFDILPSVGVVIDESKFYEYLSGYDNLALLASLKNKIGEKEINEVLALVKLKKDKMPVKKYSLGMKQRLALAQAIMENPDVLLLDEVTNGLDKSGIQMVYDLLNQEKQKGKIILITSHRQEDIDTLCDALFEIDAGEVIAHEKRN